MYSVQLNILGTLINTIATATPPPDMAPVATFTSTVSANSSITIQQPHFIDQPIATAVTNTVAYPNILATNVTHPQTGMPLFYYQSFPKVTASGKNISKFFSIVDSNGNTVDSSQYFVMATNTETRIYTNLKNTANALYFVNAVFFKNTTRAGVISAILNTKKAMTQQIDYSVTYSSTTKLYTLSQQLYSAADPDRMSVALIPYNYDPTQPWRIEVPPITMPTYYIAPSSASNVMFTATAQQVGNGIYRVNTYDVISITDSNRYVQAFDSYGYIYAPSCPNATISVVVVRGNTNQYIKNVYGMDKIAIYVINGIAVRLNGTPPANAIKIATVYCSPMGTVSITNADTVGGGLSDSSLDTATPGMYTQLNSLNVRTTADRSTYDAVYPISNNYLLAELPPGYTSNLPRGGAQTLLSAIAASRSAGSQIAVIDSNGFQIVNGYFSKTLSDRAYLTDTASSGENIVSSAVGLTETASVLESLTSSTMQLTETALNESYPQTSAVALSDTAAALGGAGNDTLAFTDSVTPSYAATSYTDIAITDKDVVF